MYKNTIFLGLLLTFITAHSGLAFANNKISTEYGQSLDGFMRIKVTNKTTLHLACYVSIDGYKVKFTLRSQRTSKWYQATDKRFKASNFSTWCDNIDFYPTYQKYVTAY